MGNRVTIDPGAGTITGVRKLRESGNSVVLTIPSEVVDSVGFDVGDMVEIVGELNGDEIILRPAPNADE